MSSSARLSNLLKYNIAVHHVVVHLERQWGILSRYSNLTNSVVCQSIYSFGTLIKIFLINWLSPQSTFSSIDFLINQPSRQLTFSSLNFLIIYLVNDGNSFWWVAGLCWLMMNDWWLKLCFWIWWQTYGQTDNTSCWTAIATENHAR